MKSPDPVTVRTYAMADVKPNDALARVPGSGAQSAIIYGVSECRIVGCNSVPDGVGVTLKDVNADTLEIDAYEFRLFSPQWELRWLRGGGTSGQAAMVIEEPLSSEALKLGWLLVSKRELYPIDDDFLMWGSVTAAAVNGVSTLAEGRIGAISVPYEAEAGKCIAITQRSYFAADAAADGNLVFAASRLTGFHTDPNS